MGKGTGSRIGSVRQGCAGEGGGGRRGLGERGSWLKACEQWGTEGTGPFLTRTAKGRDE